MGPGDFLARKEGGGAARSWWWHLRILTRVLAVAGSGLGDVGSVFRL